MRTNGGDKPTAAAHRVRIVGAWGLTICFVGMFLGAYFGLEWTRTSEGTWRVFYNEEKEVSWAEGLIFLFLFLTCLGSLPAFVITGFITRFSHERTITSRPIDLTGVAFYLSWVLLAILLMIPVYGWVIGWETDTLTWFDVLPESLIMIGIGWLLYRRDISLLGFVRPRSYLRMGVAVAAVFFISFFLDEWLTELSADLFALDPVSYREEEIMNALLEAKEAGWLFVALLTLDIGLTGPVAEEILFRGLIQQALIRRLGTAGGVLSAAFLFAAFHVDPVYFIPLFVSGVLFGVLKVVFRSLWAPILLHAAINTVYTAIGLIQM